MQLAKPAHSCAIDGHAGGTVGMQPGRRQAGISGEAVEVRSLRVKPSQDLFDNALDVVKIDGPRGV